MDYPTDEDSDGETKGFSMKIPELQDLLNEFEKDDEVMTKQKEELKNAKETLKTKGIDLEPRYEVKDIVRDKISHLDANISVQRDEQGSRLMGMVEDLNELIKDSKDKVYLR